MTRSDGFTWRDASLNLPPLENLTIDGRHRSVLVYPKRVGAQIVRKGIALRILDRYIFREVAVTWVAVTAVLLVILLSNQLARVLSQAAANEFPQGVVLALIGLTSAGYLTIIVPIGFFLAIMLALGRLYHESEMAALQSCGVGPARFYRPISILGFLIAALLIWLSFWAIPSAMSRAQEIRASAYRDAQLGMLEPGRFRTFGSGGVVFYAERVDENGVLHNVHVFVDHAALEGGTEGEIEVWVATRAEQRGAGQTEQLFVMYDGEMYQGIPGGGEFRIAEFTEAGFPISVDGGTAAAGKPEMKSTAELLSSEDARDIAEFQRRVSTPVLALVLMVLAVPLARIRPRQGRFGRMGIAILFYFIYSLLLDASTAWIESGAVPTYVGLWWVHLLALCIGVGMLIRENPPSSWRLARATR